MLRAELSHRRQRDREAGVNGCSPVGSDEAMTTRSSQLNCRSAGRPDSWRCSTARRCPAPWCAGWRRSRWTGGLSRAGLRCCRGKRGSPGKPKKGTHGVPDPQALQSPEFDAGWYHRDADHRDTLDGHGRQNSKSKWAYETHLGVMAPNDPTLLPDFPLLVVGMTTDRPRRAHRRKRRPPHPLRARARTPGRPVHRRPRLPSQQQTREAAVSAPSHGLRPLFRRPHRPSRHPSPTRRSQPRRRPLVLPLHARRPHQRHQAAQSWEHHRRRLRPAHRPTHPVPVPPQIALGLASEGIFVGVSVGSAPPTTT